MIHIYTHSHTHSNVIEMRNQHKEAFLKAHGVKLGFMSPFVRAACFALQDQPVVNAGMLQCVINKLSILLVTT